MATMMTLYELAALAKNCRTLQKRYFAKRDNLEECRVAERALDDALAALDEGPGLFDAQTAKDAKP